MPNVNVTQEALEALRQALAALPNRPLFNGLRHVLEPTEFEARFHIPFWQYAPEGALKGALEAVVEAMWREAADSRQWAWQGRTQRLLLRLSHSEQRVGDAEALRLVTVAVKELA